MDVCLGRALLSYGGCNEGLALLAVAVVFRRTCMSIGGRVVCAIVYGVDLIWRHRIDSFCRMRVH